MSGFCTFLLVIVVLVIPTLFLCQPDLKYLYDALTCRSRAHLDIRMKCFSHASCSHSYYFPLPPSLCLSLPTSIIINKP